MPSPKPYDAVMYEQVMRNWIDVIRPLFPGDARFTPFEDSGIGNDDLLCIAVKTKRTGNSGKKAWRRLEVKFERHEVEDYETADAGAKEEGNRRFRTAVDECRQRFDATDLEEFEIVVTIMV